MRAVLDANVLVSALLSRSGPPAMLVERWLLGDFELVVSETLLDAVERTLARPKIQARVEALAAAQFLSMLRAVADIAPDVDEPPVVRSQDPADDYLVALARAEGATLVSGDCHLLDLRNAIPVLSPREFLDSL